MALSSTFARRGLHAVSSLRRATSLRKDTASSLLQLNLNYHQHDEISSNMITSSSMATIDRMMSTEAKMVNDDGGPVGSGARKSLVEERIDALDFSNMTNDELSDPSSIPGWDLVHCPPRTMPRGALVGTVVSDKMDKTVNIAVDRYRIVEKYRKRLKYTRKFMAHDEAELCKVGDVVMIVPCQRISKRKHFIVKEIITAKGQL